MPTSRPTVKDRVIGTRNWACSLVSSRIGRNPTRLVRKVNSMAWKRAVQASRMSSAMGLTCIPPFLNVIQQHQAIIDHYAAGGDHSYQGLHRQRQADEPVRQYRATPGNWSTQQKDQRFYIRMKRDCDQGINYCQGGGIKQQSLCGLVLLLAFFTDAHIQSRKLSF